jgi:hypothetical protein
MLTPGQTLWYVSNEDSHKFQTAPNGAWHPCNMVIVENVGRKWATATVHHRTLRIDVETLKVDGGKYSSPGRCYRSADDYKDEIRLHAVWKNFASRISRVSPPVGMNVETIYKIAEMLSIPLKIED